MYRLIKFLFAIGTFVFLISFSLFSFLNYGFKNQQNDSFAVINHLVKSNENHQVIFLGSSLAKNNINPLVFDSVTGLSSYNFGFYGAKINHTEMILNRYLHSNHPAPKSIFLFLEPVVFDSLMKINFPVQYYPYYKDSIIYNYVSKCDSDIKLIKKFPFIGICKYNDYLKQLGIMGALYPNRVISAPIRGFEPQYGSHIQFAKDEVGKKSNVIGITKITNEGLENLDKICSTCSEKKIQLFFVLPPTFLSEKIKKGYDVEKFIAVLTPFINRYKIKLVDHSRIDLCKKEQLFFDGHHLNANGAMVYSKILAGSLSGK